MPLLPTFRETLLKSIQFKDILNAQQTFGLLGCLLIAKIYYGVIKSFLK